MTHLDDHPLLPEARLALTAVVRRQATDHRPAWLRRRPSRRVLGLAALATLASGTAVAATTPWSPQLGDERRGHPVAASSGAPAAQIAALGVLRRDQNEQDRSPDVQNAMRLLIPREDVGVRLNEIRLLGRFPNGIALLLPLERAGTHDPGFYDATVRDAICVFRTLPKGGAGKKCGTVEDLKAGRISALGSGLVPDGVDRVRVTLRTGRVLSAPVRNNYYELPIDLSSTQPPNAQTLARARTLIGQPIIWLDAAGNQIPRG